MNRSKFYDTIKRTLFKGSLSISQMSGMEAIFNEYELRQLNNLEWLAYILATAYHETGRRMQPIYENLNYSAQGLADTFPVRCAISPKETPKKPNEKAIAIAHKPISIATYVYAGKNGNGDESSGDGWHYRGRGFSQTTGRSNYKWAGCENDPDKMLNLEVSVKTMFTGMIEGRYTGDRLSDFFNSNKHDSVMARKIINRLDRAELISTYYNEFHKALTQK